MFLRLRTRRHVWPFALLGVTFAIGCCGTAAWLQAQARLMLPGLLTSRLSEALGRPVRFGALQVGPLGVAIRDFHVTRLPGEVVEPLSAERVSVSVDWWTLLTRQRLAVPGITLERATVRMAPGKGKGSGKPWTAQIAALSGSGLGKLGLRDTSIRMLTAGAEPVWSVEKIDGEIVPDAGGYRYSGRAGRYTSGQVVLTDLRLDGHGDESGVDVTESCALYQGGHFSADGKIDAAKNTVEMRIGVTDLPLAKIADRVGVPKAWALMGHITGELTIDARVGTLRRARGVVRVDRGSFTRSGSVFPWRSASARVDWTPTVTSLRDLRISGEGLSLAGGGRIDTPATEPFERGRFTLSGDLKAERTESVAALFDLLAFRRILDGRWQAGGASIHFSSAGTVGAIAHASAKGQIHLDDLRFRPTPEAAAVSVARLDARFERLPTRLVLRDIKARSEGLSAHGSAEIHDDRPSAPGRVAARGEMEIGDLTALRRIVPDSGLWTWIPVTTPDARGKLVFRAGGPTGGNVWSEGRYEVRDFRLGGPAPLAHGGTFLIPVRTLTGRFRQAGDFLHLDDLEIDARSFDAAGKVRLTLGAGTPAVAASLHLTAEDWRRLPAVPGTAFPGLSGGRLEADLRADGPVSDDRSPAVRGSFRLTGATYQPPRETAEVVPVRSLTATFEWKDRVLALPRVDLDSPLLTAAAHGRIYPDAERDYHLSLTIDGRSPEAGALAARVSDLATIEGGAASAHLVVEAPVEELEKGTLSGTLDLEDATVVQAIEPLGLKRLDAKTLRAAFSAGGGRWEFQRVALRSPALDLDGAGIITGHQVAADLTLKTSRWQAGDALPLRGGTLTATGRLAGDALDAASFTLGGEVTLEGARAAWHDDRGSASGGAISAAVHGDGPISDPVAWVRGGRVAGTGLELAVGKWQSRVAHAGARFTHDGDGFRITEATADLPGMHASGSGRWSSSASDAELALELRDLAATGLALPEGVGAKSGRLTARLQGASDQGLVSAEGRLDLTGLRFPLGKVSQTLAAAGTDFRFDGTTLHFSDLKAHGPAGNLSASGSWSKERRVLTLNASGEDPSRLGLALPEGITVGGYEIEATFSGTGSLPVSAGTGTLRVTGLTLAAGPEPKARFESASGRFAIAGNAMKLEDLRAQGPAGDLTGSGGYTAEGYRFALVGIRVDPALVRWMVPGTVEGGALSGAAVVSGRFGADPLPTARGKFELAGARYTLPDELQLLGGPIAVARLAGDYTWHAGRTTLSRLSLDSDVVDGSGELTIEEGAGRVTADLQAADAGRVAGFWPVLVGRLRGGAVSGKLDAHFDAGGTRGTLKLAGAGGTLVLPEVAAEYGQHPVDTLTLTLGFSPEKLTFDDVRLRGPRGNLDGSGVWTGSGPVYGEGKAWFTKEYTSKLVRPTGWGWLAKLVGIRQVKSDFKLGGTADRVTLNAGITRSMLWRFAKGQVPKEFREIAAGKTPLWVAPVEVAGAAAPGASR
jgi:hypothetical protein